MTLCNGVFTVIRGQQVIYCLMFFKMLWLIAPYIPLRCRLKWRSPPSCSWRRRCSLLFAWRECCRCHPFWFCNPEYRNKKLKRSSVTIFGQDLPIWQKKNWQFLRAFIVIWKNKPILASVIQLGNIEQLILPPGHTEAKPKKSSSVSRLGKP